VSAVDGEEIDYAQQQSEDQQQENEQQQQQPQRGGVHIPSQHEELEVLTVLSKDAAEILWEMVLMKHDENDADFVDMVGRAEQLRAQLRGMLNDYDGGDEVLMCRALEAFDSLNSALDKDAAVAERVAAEQEEEKLQVGEGQQEQQEEGEQEQPAEKKKQVGDDGLPNLIDF